MITQLQRIKAARRIVVGLLFVFMAMVAIAQDTPSGSGWNGTPAGSIENKDGGNGESAAAAIRIKDAAELAYFAKLVNEEAIKVHITNGNDLDITAGFKGSHIKLTADIDLNGQNWTPIGNDKFFRGHFDGDGHVVTGLKIEITSSTDYIYAGLFGNVSGGEIRNLGVRLAKDGIKVVSTKNVWVGGIVGYADNNTTIRNCYVDAEKGGKIKVKAANEFLGGIAGVLSSSGTIIHCYSTVDIEAESVAESANEAQIIIPLSIGGIVGSNYGTISHCYATGSMIGQGKGKGQVNLSIGGICGDNSNFGSLIQNNLALNKELSGKTNNGECHVNRIVGKSENSVSNNYANPQMTLSSDPKNGSTINNEDGTDTCLDDFKSHLTGISGSEWGTAWVWPDGKLPQLLKINDKDNYTSEPLGGQVAYYASNYLQPNWVYNPVDAIKNAKGHNGLSPQTPIEINTAGELAYFAKQVNSRYGIKLNKPDAASAGAGSGITIEHNGNNGEGFAGYYFALSADIELQAGEWTPIGNGKYNSFSGHFDGKGHVVKGLKMKMDVEGSKNDWTFAGLFGYVVNGTLQNIGVELADEGIEVSAKNGYVYAGGIAGKIEASGRTAILRHCYVTGGKDAKIKITEAGQYACAGGITGRGVQLNNGSLTLTHCYATVDVEANAKEDSYAGGIAGDSYNASYCYATGNVKANTYTGGICGVGIVSNCLALNPLIEGDDNNKTYRITTYSYTSNYASSLTKINSSTITSPDPDSPNGADTWLDTFKDDLRNVSGGEGWRDGNGWEWPTATSTLLPKLMVYNEGGLYSYWPGQPDIDATDYLSNQSKPEPEPEPEPDPVYPPPTPIYYTVTLPQVEGATTDPGAGDHEVESWSTFRFYLMLDSAYSDSQPIVTTSRGETLTPRKSDGAYLVKYVRTDVEVRIDSIRPNLPPVANEAIAVPTAKVWTANAHLHMQSPTAADAYIYAANGRRQALCRLTPGKTESLRLPAGIYLIRIGKDSFKIVL